MVAPFALWLLSSLLNVTSPLATGTDIFVAEFEAIGLRQDVATIAGKVVAAELQRASGSGVTSMDDLEALVGHELARDAVGCDDVTCLAEITGALAARLLVVGSLIDLEGDVVCDLRIVDTRSWRTVGRRVGVLPPPPQLFGDLAETTLKLWRQIPIESLPQGRGPSRVVQFKSVPWVDVYVDHEPVPRMVNQMGRFELQLAYGVHHLRFTNTFADDAEMRIDVGSLGPTNIQIVRLKRREQKGTEPKVEKGKSNNPPLALAAPSVFVQ